MSGVKEGGERRNRQVVVTRQHFFRALSLSNRYVIQTALQSQGLEGLSVSPNKQRERDLWRTSGGSPPLARQTKPPLVAYGQLRPPHSSCSQASPFHLALGLPRRADMCHIFNILVLPLPLAFSFGCPGRTREEKAGCDEGSTSLLHEHPRRRSLEGALWGVVGVVGS